MRPYLPAQTILAQISAAVVVTDRQGNSCTPTRSRSRCSASPTAASCSAGRAVPRVQRRRRRESGRAGQAGAPRPGRDGTFAVLRADGSRVFVRAQAMPLRQPVRLDRRHRDPRPGGQPAQQRRERDRVALLERIGEQLAGSLEFGSTLRHVAEILVPQFADHCINRPVPGRQADPPGPDERGRLDPPAGSWPGSATRSGTRGSFLPAAMSRLERSCSRTGRGADARAPSRTSLEAAEDVGLRSVVAARSSARVSARRDEPGAVRADPAAQQYYDADDRDFLRRWPAGWRWPSTTRCCSMESGGPPWPPDQPAAPATAQLDGLEVACGRARQAAGDPRQGIQTQVGGDGTTSSRCPRAGSHRHRDVEGRGARAAAVMGQLRAACAPFARTTAARRDPAQTHEWCRTLSPARARQRPRCAARPPSAAHTWSMTRGPHAVLRQRGP